MPKLFELYVSGRLFKRYSSAEMAMQGLSAYPKETLAQIFKITPTVDVQLVHEQGS